MKLVIRGRLLRELQAAAEIADVPERELARDCIRFVLQSGTGRGGCGVRRYLLAALWAASEVEAPKGSKATRGAVGG